MKVMKTKKILVMGLALILSMGFAGCSLPEEESSDKSNVFTINVGHRLEEYIDSETGVHYIKPVSSGSGLTPRLNADGTVMVDK